MHRLLERQYKKCFKEQHVNTPEFDEFLRVISTTYESNDSDRALLEHSFEVSSKEFSELNAKILLLVKELEVEKKSVEQKVSERTMELKLANERLTELDKVKTEFISVAAHQLRTPLSAIKWTLSLLMEDDMANMTVEQKSLIMKGYESNERIIRLINSMLVVTRIESGKMTYAYSYIHIEDLVESCLADFVGQATEKGLKIDFIQPPQRLPYLHVDPDKIRAVLQNFLENAIFYSKTGGTITVTAVSEDGMVRVSVKDSGIGIPQKQQVGIFSKFFRAENALKARTDGSGLGLFVAKSIIDKHGGDIGFSSVEGEGSTFYFTLPPAIIDQDHPANELK
jgi:signal transduction histidine kinase